MILSIKKIYRFRCGLKGEASTLHSACRKTFGFPPVFRFCMFLATLETAKNRKVWAPRANRITSYNVCYTKLLRVAACRYSWQAYSPFCLCPISPFYTHLYNLFHRRVHKDAPGNLFFKRRYLANKPPITLTLCSNALSSMPISSLRVLTVSLIRNNFV